MSINEREIIIGETKDYEAKFIEDNAPKPMTGLTGELRLLHSDGSTLIQRYTSTAAQFTWTDQAKGTGTWHWLSNESFTTGTYRAEVWFYDGATPKDRRKTCKREEPAEYKISNPVTGVFV